MPAASWRTSPARTMSLWLMASASAGSSRSVGMRERVQRMGSRKLGGGRRPPSETSPRRSASRRTSRGWGPAVRGEQSENRAGEAGARRRTRGSDIGPWPSPSAEEPVEDVESRQIVVDRVHHQHHEEHEADLLGDLALAHGDGSAQDRLAHEEEEMSAVQHGHGQQIEHGEVHADESREEREIRQALTRLLTGRRRDLDGPADVGGGELYGDQLVHPLDGELRPLPGLEHAVADGGEWIGADEHGADSGRHRVADADASLAIGPGGGGGAGHGL